MGGGLVPQVRTDAVLWASRLFAFGRAVRSMFFGSLPRCRRRKRWSVGATAYHVCMTRIYGRFTLKRYTILCVLFVFILYIYNTRIGSFERGSVTLDEQVLMSPLLLLHRHALRLHHPGHVRDHSQAGAIYHAPPDKPVRVQAGDHTQRPVLAHVHKR